MRFTNICALPRTVVVVDKTTKGMTTWATLGTVQPDLATWQQFPVVSSSGNDLIRISFDYPQGSLVRGWAWLRCRYEMPDGVVATQSQRIYPSSIQQTIINFPIPADLREKGIISRIFETKKGLRRRDYALPDASVWSMTVEELLD